MQADRTRQDVVDVILTLARKLNCEVIAEGVEKPAQIESLRTMGCSLAQGYFFRRPWMHQQPCNFCSSCKPSQ